MAAKATTECVKLKYALHRKGSAACLTFLQVQLVNRTVIYL